MHKPLRLLLCFSLAGIFLLSACNGKKVETQVAVNASPDSNNENSSVLLTPTIKATSTRVSTSTQTPIASTRTARPTATPTVTGTMTVGESAAEIDLLLKNLATDLANTGIVQDTEIP